MQYASVLILNERILKLLRRFSFLAEIDHTLLHLGYMNVRSLSTMLLESRANDPSFFVDNIMQVSEPSTCIQRSEIQ